MLAIAVTLTDEDGDALQRLRRDATLTPLERDHVEILVLADAGWSAAKIGTHVRRCAESVRTLMQHFESEGPACVRCQPPGPPPNTARRDQITTALEALLAEERTATAPQRQWRYGVLHLHGQQHARGPGVLRQRAAAESCSCKLRSYSGRRTAGCRTHDNALVRCHTRALPRPDATKLPNREHGLDIHDQVAKRCPACL